MTTPATVPTKPSEPWSFGGAELAVDHSLKVALLFHGPFLLFPFFRLFLRVAGGEFHVDLNVAEDVGLGTFAESVLFSFYVFENLITAITHILEALSKSPHLLEPSSPPPPPPPSLLSQPLQTLQCT
jgi:hypothetical protein